MDKLSPETVSGIFRHVECKKDLTNLRLVQRSFADLAGEFLFETINIEPSFDGLLRLLRISRKPEFARLVRQVVVHVADFKELTWNPYVKRVLSRPRQDEARKARVFEEYKNSDTEFFRFQTTPDYTAMLSVSLSHLPRLEGVGMKHQLQDTEYFPYDDAPDRAERFLSRRMDFNRRYSLEEFHGENGELDDLRSFKALVDAAYISDLKLTSFRTSGSIGQAVFEDDELLRRATSVFTTCRVLELDFSFEHWYDTDQHVENNPLFGILKPATHLEKLKLSGALRQDPETSLAIYLGESYVWPCLKNIDFMGLGFHEHELNAFMERHKRTLKDVSIWHCKLYSGSWPDVMRFMRRAKFDLEWLSLDVDLQDIDPTGEEYIYDEGQNMLMMRYVMDEEDALPVSGERKKAHYVESDQDR